MPKLKLVNSKNNETAIIDVADLTKPVYDIVRNYYKVLTVEPTYTSDEAVKAFLRESVSLQVMTKNIPFRDIIGKNLSFNDIGVTSSMKIGIYVDSKAEKSQTERKENVADKIKASLSTVAKPLKKDTKKHHTHEKVVTSHTENDDYNYKKCDSPFDRDAIAIAPTKKLAIDKDDGYDAEVTLDDFKNYYEHIRKDSSNDFPDFKEKEKEELEECHIRIKFPDRTILQAKFTNKETSELLYDFVTNSLEMPDSPFELHFAHPLKRVERSDKLLLIRDLGFEKRTSLIFKTQERNVPYLKKSIQLRDLFDEKKRQDSQNNEELSKAALKKQKFEEKMSKFLKLSKK